MQTTTKKARKTRFNGRIAIEDRHQTDEIAVILAGAEISDGHVCWRDVGGVHEFILRISGVMPVMPLFL